MKSWFRALLLILLPSILFAQNIKKEIQTLEDDFKSFNYQRVIEKGRFLLSDTFTNREDSLAIYQLMLSSAYALTDTSLARDIILDIIHCEPGYSLNPKETSPKIIELFNYVKNQAQQKTNLELSDSDHRQELPYPFPSALRPHYALAGMVFPGSGHLLAGKKTRGLVTSGVSAALLGSVIYSIILTDDRRHDYMAARGDVNYDQLYDRYNSDYKTRNLLIITYAVWSLYNLYDLHRQTEITAALLPGKMSVSLQISKSF